VEWAPESGAPSRHAVAFGTQQRVPTAGERGKLTATPERGFDLGAGKGKPVARTVRAGVVGLVVDARGRKPFALPEEPAARIARLREWNRALDLYPREV
jgi:hypothetical protein